MCPRFQYAGYDYVCYPTYLGVHKILKVPGTLSSLIQLLASDVYIMIMVTNEITAAVAEW